MSSDRSNSNTNRLPLRPTLSSNRTARTPITPRVAANATPSTKSTASKPTPSVRSEPPTPRVKQANTPVKDALANGNVTPRSSTRGSRPGSATTSPTHTDNTVPSFTRPKSALVASVVTNERAASVGGQSRAPTSTPKTFAAGGSAKIQSPLIRQPTNDSIDNHFFRASDAPKLEPAPKKPEPKKAHFFHADGKSEDAVAGLPAAPSTLLSAISEKRPSGPWTRPEDAMRQSRSPPMLSPALSTLSGASSFFPTVAPPPGMQRSPSPSKENIHLSYRKGASQIFGTRPNSMTRSTDLSADNVSNNEPVERNNSGDRVSPNITRHRKSTSLSSIDSGHSIQARRRSATTVDLEPVPSPLIHEVKAHPTPRVAKPPNDLPSIDTSLESPSVLSRTNSGLSPTRPVSELAADARRERKVLDLEISNSSLLAINSSLEREVRRQKAELKRFRRLSRAGRFSFAPGERMRGVSQDLSALDEEDEDDDVFGLPTGSTDPNDDMSDDEESLTSSADPMSPSAQDRLARDEKHLQLDLERHKEMLMQSQAMNQTIKRCMYATEDMIKEGQKALDYHVRVSDVKLGGRVLTNDDENDDEDQMIDVEDETLQNDQLDQAKGLLDVWSDVGRKSFESSEGGDRDSGIEVDRPPNASRPLVPQSANISDTGRPPGASTQRPRLDVERFGSLS